MIKKLLYTTLCLLALHGCKIENDIPYPIVEGNITAFEVEGQRAESEGGNVQATISTQNRAVTLYVDDSVDLSELKITRLGISVEAELIPDSAACKDYKHFPREGFDSLDNLPLSMDTRMDFTQPVKFTLRTYQDYIWTVTVNQIIEREIVLENQIGNPIIDVNTRSVIIYVSPDQPLDAIKVTTFNLGGEHGKVVPNPEEYATFDFSTPQEFYVSNAWEEASYAWKVYVYHKESSGATSDVFARVTTADLNGTIQNGKTPIVEYKTESDNSWTSLPASAVTVRGTSFSASFSGLRAGTTYQYRVNIDGVAGTEQTFTTAPATPLENGSFEDWSEETAGIQILYKPWASGSNSFWSTGNQGSAPFIGSITTPTDDSVSGKAAHLQSRWAAIKLAAGNIFTGDFALDGTNGVLTLGREFASFPSALRFSYKYKTSKVNRVKEDRLEYMRNQNDSCHVYFALTSEKYIIRTAKGDSFNRHDPSVIAYGEFASNQNQTTYKEIEVPFEYYDKKKTPSYLIIVCSSSKYGDFFTGGDASEMFVDEMELVYE